MTREKAYKLRELIVKASAGLSDEDALEGIELFPAWQPDTYYLNGQRVRDEEFLYKLIPETHHSQADWPPHLVPAIWARVDDPAEEWPEWRQPTGAQDAYAKGAKVSHNEQHWVSDVDNNVWEPGAAGTERLWLLAD